MAQQQAKIIERPVDWDELYPGRFIKATDFKGKQVTLRIAKVHVEELVGDKGPQMKGIIAFDKTDKALALNKTNGICLKEMFGKKVQEWVGKRVTLFPSVWDGEDCIRVYGSPDIAEDKEVTIALPRKRPFKMTMHKTGIAAPANTAGNSGSTKGAAPVDADQIAAIRAAQTADALAEARKTVWGLYAAAGKDVPREVDAAANDRAETIAQQQQNEGLPS